jgi:sulfonate transport system ATP-binding protein
MLELDIAAKSFGAHAILRGLHLRVAARETVAILGPSGCGKSTLLRIAAGLDRSYAGSVSLNGSAGVVFQEPRLMPWLTVADNVGFPLGPRKGADARVARLLDELGLADAAGKFPKELSGGMAQRAALARAFVTEPQLILLDEPFSAVDAFTRARLQDLLLRVAAHHGTAVLLVTHDIDEALYLGDRVLILGGYESAGRIAGEYRLAAPRPRDRGDPDLNRLRSGILKLLAPAETRAAA